MTLSPSSYEEWIIDVAPDWNSANNDIIDYSAPPTVRVTISPGLSLEERVNAQFAFDSEIQAMSDEEINAYGVSTMCVPDLKSAYIIRETKKLPDSLGNSTTLEVCFTGARRSQVAAGVGVANLVKTLFIKTLTKDT